MSRNNTLTSVVEVEDTTRTVAETAVAPGGTTTVTVSVEFEDEPELEVGEIVRFDDELSESAAGVEHISGSPVPGAAGPNESRDEYRALWNESTDSYSTSYELTVPETADFGSEITLEGAFEIAGTVESVPSETITVEPGDPGVELRPSAPTAVVDSQTSLNLVVTGAVDGVGSFDIALSLDDTDVATFAAVNVANATESDDSTVSDDSVTVDATLSEPHDAKAGIPIAEITLDTGGEEDETDIDVDSAEVSDTGDDAYDIEETAGATLTVTDGPPQIDSNFAGPPQDETGDNLFEDVNGDGEVDMVDVQALFDNLDEDTLQDNAEFFDFSDTGGQVSIFDVQALFTRVKELND